MEILVGYDVETTSLEGRRRLRRASIACKDYGQRVQFSLFECRVSQAQLEALEARLKEIMDAEKDSLRIYILGDRGHALRVYGRDRHVDFDDVLVR